MKKAIDKILLYNIKNICLSKELEKKIKLQTIEKDICNV